MRCSRRLAGGSPAGGVPVATFSLCPNPHAWSTCSSAYRADPRGPGRGPGVALGVALEPDLRTTLSLQVTVQL